MILIIYVILIFIHKVYIIFVPIHLVIYYFTNFKLKTNIIIPFIIFLIFSLLIFNFYGPLLLMELDFYNIKSGEPNLNLTNIFQFIEEYRKNTRDGSGYPTEFRKSRTLYDYPSDASILFRTELHLLTIFSAISGFVWNVGSLASPSIHFLYPS